MCVGEEGLKETLYLGNREEVLSHEGSILTQVLGELGRSRAEKWGHG